MKIEANKYNDLVLKLLNEKKFKKKRTAFLFLSSNKMLAYIKVTFTFTCIIKKLWVLKS